MIARELNWRMCKIVARKSLLLGMRLTQVICAAARGCFHRGDDGLIADEIREVNVAAYALISACGGFDMRDPQGFVVLPLSSARYVGICNSAYRKRWSDQYLRSAQD